VTGRIRSIEKSNHPIIGMDNIKMDLEGVGYNGVDSVHIDQDMAPMYFLFVKTGVGYSRVP
jgi:hypothetical protein